MGAKVLDLKYKHEFGRDFGEDYFQNAPVMRDGAGVATVTTCQALASQHTLNPAAGDVRPGSCTARTIFRTHLNRAFITPARELGVQGVLDSI